MALSTHVVALGAICCWVASSCASGNPAHPNELTDHGGSAAPPPASTTVTADDLARAGDDAIVKALSNKVPGVWVGMTAEGNLAVRIRGTNSIAANTEPLYVIDGLAVQPGPGGALLGINPHDIASIEVLKDAASLSFYGVRAANGVILVTTKHSN